jgi:undecaprenyl-diphosphatase
MSTVEGFKHLVHSVRPWGIQESPSGFSFPSGHTTLATTFYVGYALLLSYVYPSKKRLFIYTSIVIAFLTSISRLYLGAHWFTDIIGGWLLSTALLLLIVISYNRKTHLPRNITGLTSSAIIIFALVYGIICLHSIHHLKNNYALKDYPEQSITMKHWIDQEDNRLPHFRIGRFGLAEEAFNLELLGQLESIKDSLLKNHWETPPERDWISVLLRLSDVSSTEYLPLVSPLYEDKKPVLVLIKHTENKKRVMVLRMWESNIIIEPEHKPLWVGTLSMIPRTYSWLFRKKHHEIPVSPDLLFEEKNSTYRIKSVTALLKRNKQIKPHTILLIQPKT